MDVVFDDLINIDAIFNQTPGLSKLFADPLLKERHILSIIDKIFKPYVDSLTFRFLTVLANKNRIGILAKIPDQFKAFYNDHNEISEVRIETALGISDKLRETIIKKLEQKTGKSIVMTCDINRSLIGGFRLYFENRLIDLSVSGRLQKIKTSLLEKF